MNRSDAVLELRGVWKSFGRTEIIRGVDLAVRRGTRHAIIGPNGAGKSTLFNLISGSISVSRGEILLNDIPIQNRSPHRINRQGLGRSFQITHLFPRLSSFEHIRLGRLSKARRRYSIAQQADAMTTINAEAGRLMRDVGLHGSAFVMAGDLAYSDQRSLEIGTTVSTEPELVLLDEPTAGMSREETRKSVELVREMTRGKTLLVVEHDMDVVFSLCDVVSVLVYGQIIATGTPQAIRQNRAVQEAYLGVELDSHA
jgi:branched-chain amino acid transport system ATP-binding protein